MKFWNAASWSNLSAQMPASRPSIARIALPSSANVSAQTGCGIARSDGAKNSVTRNTPVPTTMPRTMAPST